MEILGVIDWVVVALYFVVIGGISIWTRPPTISLQTGTSAGS
jgi:hypothetical protein